MKGSEEAKITIEANPKEIADITKALQSQLKEKFSTAVVDAVMSEITEKNISESGY